MRWQQTREFATESIFTENEGVSYVQKVSGYNKIKNKVKSVGLSTKMENQ